MGEDSPFNTHMSTYIGSYLAFLKNTEAVSCQHAIGPNLTFQVLLENSQIEIEDLRSRLEKEVNISKSLHDDLDQSRKQVSRAFASTRRCCCGLKNVLSSRSLSNLSADDFRCLSEMSKSTSSAVGYEPLS